jgi:hypothetical protein
VTALPQAAFFLLLEAAVGGAIALLWLDLQGQVPTGFTRFTGACFVIFGALAIWLRSSFPPPELGPFFQAERVLTFAFVATLAAYLVIPRVKRGLGPLTPLVGLAGLWAASSVVSSPQLGGLGVPLAVLAGAIALGSAFTALSLGHWYLVSPTLSTQPLIRVSFLCLGALIAQLILLPILLFGPGTTPQGQTSLFTEDALFLGVRVIFGLAVPLAACFMAWRTARIRSLDSATGLLYIVAALILAGEITARTLFFLTGVAT